MQELLRQQPAEINDIDLVSECFSFLKEVEPELDKTCYDQLIKCLETMIEFVQGNISKGNTMKIIDSKGIELLAKLLESDAVGENLKPYQQDLVRSHVATLLCAMLEGNDDRVEERMLRVLDLKELAKMADRIYVDVIKGGEEDDNMFALGKDLVGNVTSGITDIASAAANAAGIFEDEEEEDEEEISKAEQTELQTSTGFAIYLLVKDLVDYKEETEGLSAEEDTDHDGKWDVLQEPNISNEALEHYEKYTAHVEILNSQGELERVQFRFPECCQYLNEDSKEAFVLGVDRETPGAQLQEFYEKMEDFQSEMVHLERLEKFRAWRILMTYKPIATRTIFSLALITNILVMAVDFIERRGEFLEPEHGPVDGVECQALNARWSPPSEDDGGDGGDRRLSERNDLCVWSAKGKEYEELYDIIVIVNKVSAALMMLSAIIVFVIYSLQSGPVRQDKLWREHHRIPFNEAAGKATRSVIFGVKFLFYSLIYLFYDLKLLFFCAEFIAAVLGFVVSRYFYSVLLLDIVMRDQDLQNVFRAVTEHGRSLLITGFFGLIMMYYFSIIALITLQPTDNQGERSFLFYDNDPIGSDPMGDTCVNLVGCFVTIVSEGLRQSDIGAVMNPRAQNSPYFAWQTFFTLAFFIIITIILLNVIFGIIIDTFSELREQTLAVKQDMENKCFISRLDRFTLDTKGDGFEKHIKENQNMWAYLFMVVHVRTKEPNDYNGWESYIAHKLKTKDLNFFPQRDAISLAQYNARESEESQKQQNQITTTAKRVDQVIATQDEIKQSQEKLMEEVRELHDKLSNPAGMEERLDAMMRGLEEKMDAAFTRISDTRGDKK
jgi:hypothetical protein